MSSMQVFLLLFFSVTWLLSKRIYLIERGKATEICYIKGPIIDSVLYLITALIPVQE